jgi:hypothetical protein
MATTINSIISQACQLAQLTSAEFNEEPSGQLAAQALIGINNILQQFNVDQLLPYAKKLVTYTIPTSKEYYTIGKDSDDPMNVADIDYDRPEFIGTIFYRTSTNATPYRLFPFALEDVRANLLRGSTGTPRYFATNNGFPFVEIYFDMKPTSCGILEIIYNKSIPRYKLNDSLDVPLSYNDLFVTALARWLGVNANAELIGRIDRLYQESINRITVGNSRNQILLNSFNANYIDYDGGTARALGGGY